MPQAAQAVIFDMDGVLLDSYQAHLASWQETAARRGVEMTEDQFARTFGQTNATIIPALYGDRFHAAAVQAFGEEKEEAYRAILRAVFPAMDGAAELIDALHAAGFRLAIGSSAPRANVECVFTGLAAARHIEAHVCGGDVTHGKPHPEVFLKAAERLGLPPCACAVIEDSLPGLEAARRAGMIAIGLTGTAPREALAAHAHRVVSSLRDLTPAAIASWIRAGAAA